MVACKNCNAHNSLDSAFCKKCGTTLPEDDIRIAQERLDVAVADGFKIFSSGRVEEAMQVAEEAVRTNPLSTSALSLKAMCHERRGEIAEAIECHERVLDIDPDSMIDRIKVKDLRNLLVQRTAVAGVPDRRMAIFGAVAAFVLVTSIGVLAAKGVNGAPETKKIASNEVAQQPTNPGVSDQQTERFGDTPAKETAAGTTPNSGAGQTQPNNNNEAPPVRTQPDQQTNSPGSRDVPVPAYNGGGRLPKPEEGPDSPIRGGIGPVLINKDQLPPDIRNPKQPPTGNANTNNGVPNRGSIDPDPTPDRGTNDPAPRSNGEAPGIMEIKVLGGKGSTGGDAGTSSNGVEALMRTARHQYQIGNWAAAAQSYERALRAGADAAGANQRLAQCYEKLGRNGDAVAAYSRAIAALEGSLNGGGDKDRINAALDSCRQALKVLGG